MNYMIDENHAKWLRAFRWWFDTANKDQIIELLHEGVALSPKDAMFFAAVLNGSAQPLKSKQTGPARFRSNILNNKISQLRNRGFTRKEILADLKRTGLYKNHIAEFGLDKRLYKPSSDYVKRHAELMKKFDTLYKNVTAD